MNAKEVAEYYNRLADVAMRTLEKEMKPRIQRAVDRAILSGVVDRQLEERILEAVRHG